MEDRMQSSKYTTHHVMFALMHGLLKYLLVIIIPMKNIYNYILLQHIKWPLQQVQVSSILYDKLKINGSHPVM